MIVQDRLATQGGSWSQDVWVVTPPLPAAALAGSDFQLGLPGCDNRVAAVLADAGLRLANPCQKVVCRHLHLSDFRHHPVDGSKLYAPAHRVVPGPYEMVEPANLWRRLVGEL